MKSVHRVIDQKGIEYPCCRATNDNGCDWEGKFRVENLKGLEDENKLYSFVRIVTDMINLIQTLKMLKSPKGGICNENFVDSSDKLYVIRWESIT